MRISFRGGGGGWRYARNAVFDLAVEVGGWDLDISGVTAVSFWRTDSLLSSVWTSSAPDWGIFGISPSRDDRAWFTFMA